MRGSAASVIALAREQLLGERRAIVGRLSLAADDSDRGRRSRAGAASRRTVWPASPPPTITLHRDCVHCCSWHPSWWPRVKKQGQKANEFGWFAEPLPNVGRAAGRSLPIFLAQPPIGGLRMRTGHTRIAAASAAIAATGLARLSLRPAPQSHVALAASNPAVEVRTEVIRRTIHVVHHVKPRASSRVLTGTRSWQPRPRTLGSRPEPAARHAHARRAGSTGSATAVATRTSGSHVSGATGHGGGNVGRCLAPGDADQRVTLVRQLVERRVVDRGPSHPVTRTSGVAMPPVAAAARAAARSRPAAAGGSGGDGSGGGHGGGHDD